MYIHTYIYIHAHTYIHTVRTYMCAPANALVLADNYTSTGPRSFVSSFALLYMPCS